MKRDDLLEEEYTVHKSRGHEYNCQRAHIWKMLVPCPLSYCLNFTLIH